MLHSQDSPRVPKRRDALSSHPSSSMAPSSLFSRLARLAVCLANMSLLATAEVSTKPWVQKVFYAMGPEEITLVCPVGFSFNCKSICCDWPYMDPRTCAEFGVNFTKAKQSDCTGCATQEQECCECVSSAPPITSLPQSTGIHHVTSKECELAAADRYMPSSCYLANLTCPQGFVLSEPLMGCGSCLEGYATRVCVNESSYCITSPYSYDNGFPSWVCQTCVQEQQPALQRRHAMECWIPRVSRTDISSGGPLTMLVGRKRVHAAETMKMTTMQATTMLWSPTASMSARESVFWSCRSAKVLSTALVGVKFGQGLEESL